MSTPYMNLDLPVPSTTLGPAWASMLNTALSAIDAHDHTDGKGLPVTPAGMLINADLDFAGHAASDVESVQLSTLTSYLLTPSNIHSVNGNLVWVNASGVAVPITSGNAVVGAPGNIQNLNPPASAAYSALTSTFRWYSGAGVMAGTDTGFLLLRAAYNALANAVQVQAPASVPSTWTLTLPTGPGGSPTATIATINPTGAMGYYYLDEYTITQTGTLIGVPNGGIRGQLGTGAGTPTGQLALRTIGEANIGLGQITGGISGVGAPTGLLAYRTIVTENIAERAVTTAKVGLDTITGGTGAGLGNLAPATIRSYNIPYNEINGDRLADTSVLGLKIANAPNGLPGTKLNDSAVDSRVLANNAVTTAKIQNDQVTLEKVSQRFASGANAFSANNNTIGGTFASPWVIATTGNIDLVSGKTFRITFNASDNSSTFGYLWCINYNSTEQYVYLRLRLRRSSGGTILRTYRWGFYMRPNILGNQIPYNIDFPAVCDTATESSGQYAVLEIFTDSGSSTNVAMTMDNVVLSIATL